MSLLFILQSVCVFVDDVTVLEVLKFQVAYVPSVKERSSHDVVQRNDGLLMVILMVILVFVLTYIVYALEGQEHWVLPFKLVRTRSIGCRLLSSCEQGALCHIQFRLMQARRIVPCAV